jgi:translocation and assembly module TamA
LPPCSGPDASRAERDASRAERASRARCRAGGAAQSNPIPTTPILPDKDFDAALPPISDNPDAPMGTVQDWAKQQQTPAAKAPATPPTATTAQDGTLAPLPAPDPDLARPLTPLDSFNTEPYVTAADVKDKPETDLHYDWKITGVDKIADRNPVSPIDGNAIRSQFSAVSALKEGKGKAANAAMISARMQQDQKTLADVLSSQGFFDASVHGSIETPQTAKDEQGKQAAQEPGKITVVLDVAPGPRYALGAIKFDAPPVTPSDLISKSFVPKSGEPIVADRILSAEAGIGVTLPENGYPFVKVGQRDVLLDAAARTGDYTLPVTPGPRSKFGDIVMEGKKRVFKPRHVATIARFKKGELYDSRKVDDLRKALVATNLYSVVTVEPQQTGTASGEDTEYANLLVKEQAGPPRSLAAQLGYATGEGIKATGSWTHANMFPPEGALIGTATLGTNEQGLSGTFRRANAGQRDRTFELGIGADHSNVNAYEAYTGKLYGRMSYASTPLWQKRWTYSYGFEVVGTNEKDYDFTVSDYRRRTFYVLALPGQVTYDRSNSLLDPTKGYKLSVTISPETSLGTGGQVYARDLRGDGLLAARQESGAGRARQDRQHSGRLAGIAGALAAALFGRRRIGARLRLSGTGAQGSQRQSHRRPQPDRDGYGNPLPFRQLRSGGLCRWRSGLHQHLALLHQLPAGRGHRRAALHQFRAAALRHRHADPS